MQDPAGFFKQRALAAFHRRKRHPLGSEERKHNCAEARMFLKSYRRSLSSERQRHLEEVTDPPPPRNSRHSCFLILSWTKYNISSALRKRGLDAAGDCGSLGLPNPRQNAAQPFFALFRPVPTLPIPTKLATACLKSFTGCFRTLCRSDPHNPFFSLL